MTATTKTIYDNDYYTVGLTDNALGEDGKYGVDGYVVRNKETGIAEYTTLMLPQAMYQADAMAGALGNLATDGDSADAIGEDVSEDVAPETIQ